MKKAIQYPACRFEILNDFLAGAAKSRMIAAFDGIKAGKTSPL